MALTDTYSPMNFQTFIFSRSKEIVYLRHVTFWTIWIMFYTTQLYFARYNFTEQPVSNLSHFLSSFIHVLATAFIDMAYVYTIIYLLIPKLFFRGKFVSFFVSWLFLTVFTAFCFRVQYQVMIIPIEEFFGFKRRALAPLPNAIFSMTISIGFEGCMAAAIVFGKHWYKSNQNLLQARRENYSMNLSMKHTEKLSASHFVVRDIFKDLAFDIRKMNCGDDQINAVKSKSAYILDFLNSYFEHSGNGRVSLNQELEGLKKYLAIKEQDHYSYDPVIAGPELDNKIAGNILLPLTALPYKNESIINKDKSIKVNIKTRGDSIIYNLCWHKKNIRDNLERAQFELLQMLKKYLEFNYPKSHKLTVSINDAVISILLNIKLKEGI